MSDAVRARHSIELTKRGYNVTGIDLSESQLQRAREKAEAENLKIDFLKLDARSLPFKSEFDTAIMLCEGSFPLMETDEMNFGILENVAKSLKKNAEIHFYNTQRTLPPCITPSRNSVIPQSKQVTRPTGATHLI